jgi:hypothetical protein
VTPPPERSRFWDVLWFICMLLSVVLVIAATRENDWPRAIFWFLLVESMARDSRK